MAHHELSWNEPTGPGDLKSVSHMVCQPFVVGVPCVSLTLHFIQSLKENTGRLMTGEFRLPYPPVCFAFPVLGSSSYRMTKVNRPSPGRLRVQVWSKEQSLLDRSIRCPCRPTACCSPDRLLAFLLPRLDTNNERLRVGTLQILRHIVNSAGECPLCLQAGPLSMRGCWPPVAWLVCDRTG